MSNHDLEHSHRPADMAARLAKGPKASYLYDAVFGAIDGTVTTFAVVAGALPLLPFLFALPDPAVIATGITAIVFFLIGSERSHWSPRSWLAGKMV